MQTSRLFKKLVFRFINLKTGDRFETQDFESFKETVEEIYSIDDDVNFLIDTDFENQIFFDIGRQNNITSVYFNSSERVRKQNMNIDQLIREINDAIKEIDQDKTILQ